MAKSKKSTNKGNSGERKVFHAESRKQRNKKLALLLLLSLAVFLTIYFAFIKAGFYSIIYVYIVASSVAAIGYIFCAFAIAFFNRKMQENENDDDKRLVQRLDKLRKAILLVLLPLIVALLLDFMLINLNLAKHFDI